MKTLRSCIFCTSRVTHQKGSWKWQDAYAKSTYGVKRAKDGHLMLFSISQSKKFSLNHAPKTDYTMTQHRRKIEARDIEIFRERVRQVFGHKKMERAERLMRRIIKGIPV